MRLYYTVIQGDEVIQVSSRFSLGGFKSQSRVPNSQIGNLFSDISNSTVSSYNQNQYMGLVLINELTVPVINAKVWFVFPDKCYSLLRIAAVDMAADQNGNMQMEHIQTIYDKPLMADFVEADGEDNKVGIGDLAVGEKVGIWIERELLLDFIKTDQNAVYKDDPVNLGRVLPVPLTTLDDIQIGISWD